MTASNFDACYKRIRVYEGGNVDLKADPGGRTSRGIIQRVYDGYRNRIGQPPRDVYLATDAEVKAIYRQQYWNAIKGDDLPDGVDLIVFDGAVNSGPGQSTKWLQAALGVTVDGALGQASLGALQSVDPIEVIRSVAQRRMAFLHHLKTFATFGRGWTSRVSDVTKAAEAMAAGAKATKMPKASTAFTEKASVADIKTPPVSAETSTGMTGAGLSLETANETVRGAAEHVQAVADVSNVLRYVFIGLTLLGLALTAYAFWHSHRSARIIAGDAQRDVPA